MNNDKSSEISRAAQSIRASASEESVTVIPGFGGDRRPIALLGLGQAALTPDTIRNAAGAAARKLAQFGQLDFVLELSSLDEVIALMEGAGLGSYDFTQYKSQKNDSTGIESINVVSSIEVDQSDIELVRAKIAAVATVKNLVNTPSSDMTPQILTEIALSRIADLKITSTVWDERKLVEDGLGGILGVGAGSVNPPRLVKLDYAPDGARRHIALVGKGITFDTGGLTLKSGAGMVGMKYDMTGAATVLAVIEALATINSDVHVTAWMCLAENMPSPTATKPNDVLKIRNGKTVEVLNTDAEGRLVLADGLSMASEEHPDLIIDIATLTGAAKGALGTRTVGAMGNTNDADRFVQSAAKSGENAWRMPLPVELRALLNSDIADLINGRPGNTTAGMLLAGVFLEEFVGNKQNDEENSIPWIHLDIAGTADNAGSAYGFTGAGPTGVTVRALIDFVRSGA
ncbi:MAG: hypothetical protein RLZZ600_1173 [Actinomycetota bacterium]